VIAALHLLRPLWLLALVPATLVLWRIARSSDPARRWEQWIDAHLLPHLLVHGAGRRGMEPWHLLAAVWLLAVVAASGPSWRSVPSPFSQDRSDLFVVLKVAASMEAGDVAPSRLERAVLELEDLLELRRGTRNGLVAYAGSAHLVTPPTADADVVLTFARALAPDVLPEPGDRSERGIALALERLARSDAPGSIVLITDSFGEADAEAVLALDPAPGAFQVLALASREDPAMRTAVRRAKGLYVLVTADDSDARRLARGVDVSLVAGGDEQSQRRQDEGWWLVPLIALLTCMWFRRGWVVSTG